jgi:hypothetical protein
MHAATALTHGHFCNAAVTLLFVLSALLLLLL